MTPAEITEDDWIKPLVVVREIAAEHGFTLTHAEEQALCAEAVEALTAALVDEIRKRKAS